MPPLRAERVVTLKILKPIFFRSFFKLALYGGIGGGLMAYYES